jgi:hypothetical protein
MRVLKKCSFHPIGVSPKSWKCPSLLGETAFLKPLSVDLRLFFTAFQPSEISPVPGADGLSVQGEIKRCGNGGFSPGRTCPDLPKLVYRDKRGDIC